MSLRRNALLLLLVTGLLAIAGDWSGNAEWARLWRLPAGLLLLGLAYEVWLAAAAAPVLEVRTSARWFLGRSMPLQLLLRHGGRGGRGRGRELTMELAPAAPAEISMDRSVRLVRVPAAARGVLTLTATARRLGRFEWPRVPARIGGVLGLAWWPRQLAPACRVQVVPDLLRDAGRTLGTGTRGAQSALRLGAGAEVLQLRDYRPVDPARAIDWKASARLGKLISRDFSEDQHLEIVLAIDTGRASGLRAGDSDRLALYANVASRFAQRAATLDDRVGLLIYADRPLAALAPARGTAAVMRLRERLAEARVHGSDVNPLLAALRIRALVRQRSLIVLLTGLDEPGSIGELSGAVRLLLPKHLPFIAGVVSEQAETLASAPVADTLDAYRALAAQEYCGAIARNVRALRALGAAAIVARPNALDQAVLEAYLRFRQRRKVA